MTATAEAPAITRQHFQSKLAERTLKNPEFRSAFMADPKGTLEKEFNTKFAENVQIFAHEEDANTLHLSIPQVPANVEELSDEDLEKVAGGILPFLVGVMVGANIVVAGRYYGWW
jgi:hypothetical protein